MSGEYPIEIEKMNICPCCHKKANLVCISTQTMMLGGITDEDGIEVPHLVLKFSHYPEILSKTGSSASPDWLCEAEMESGGYQIEIPILTNGLLSQLVKDEHIKKILVLFKDSWEQPMAKWF